MRKWLFELDKLLVMRGIAALAVVASHSAGVYLLPPARERLQVLGHNISCVIVPNGKMAVVIFFVLSGYLMFKAFRTERYKLNVQGILSFWHSRARRIMPLYYFLIFFFILFYTLPLLDKANWSTLIHLLTFTYEGSPKFVGAFWSISTEMQFYVLVPLLFFVATKVLKTNWQKVLAAFSLVVLAVLGRHLFANNIAVSPNAYPQLFIFGDAFIIGGATVFALEFLKSRGLYRILSKGQWLAIAVSLGLSIIPLASIYGNQFTAYGFNTVGITVTSVFAALFIIAAELSTPAGYIKKTYSLSAVIADPKLIPEFIGATSYGIYLWHTPIIERLRYFPVHNPLSLREACYHFLVLVLFSISCSYLSYKFIESYRPKAESTLFARLPLIFSAYTQSYRRAKVYAYQCMTAVVKRIKVMYLLRVGAE